MNAFPTQEKKVKKMDETKDTKNNGVSITAVSLIAIMAMFLVNRGVNIVTPAMNTFFQHFSDYSQDMVSMISTLPNLTLVIGSLVVGMIVGKKVKYRTMAIVGSLLYLIGGVLPYFFDDLMMTLVCRLIFGFGLGLIYPLANALLTGIFDGDKRAAMLGYGTFLLNIGGIILQTLGGVLADISWQMTFLAHAVSLLALVCAFLLPEPQAKAPAASGEKKRWLTRDVMVIGIFFFVIMLMLYPMMLKLSTIYADRLGVGATVASTALSLYTVLGAIGGFTFGTFFKKLKRWVLPISALLMTVGIVMVYYGNSYAVMTVGVCIVGLGFGYTMPGLLTWNGKVSAPGTAATSTAFVLALMNLAGFVSTFYLQAFTAVFGESVYSPIMASMIVMAVVTVIFLAYSPFKQKAEAA